MHIAILTDHRYVEPDPYDWYNAQIIYEEALLASALTDQAGECDLERVDWADPTVDWAEFDAAVFRTTWDYFDRFEEFSQWLDRVDPICRLIHDAQIVRWNMDKRYLLELQELGVSITPTRLVDGHTNQSALEDLARHWAVDELVIKPVVSGAARDTYRLSPQQAHPQLVELSRSKAMLVQPFIADILADGEWSIMVMDGVFTHGVRKRPAPGDYRVQDDHGGTVHMDPVPNDLQRFAERVVQLCPHELVYARVDVVKRGSEWLLMELEAIEPELFMRFCPASATKLARGVLRQLRS